MKQFLVKYELARKLNSKSKKGGQIPKDVKKDAFQKYDAKTGFDNEEGPKEQDSKKKNNNKSKFSK